MKCHTSTNGVQLHLRIVCKMGIVTSIYKIFIAREICRETSIVGCIAMSIHDSVTMKLFGILQNLLLH